MYRNLLFIIIIFITNIAISQNIKIRGKILDQNKQAIIYANIWIEKTGIGTVSNTDGEFILNIPEKYKENTLNISYIGYSSYTKRISKLLKYNTYTLKTSQNILGSIDVNSGDFVKSILENAYNSIERNYPKSATEYTVFYQARSSYRDSILNVAEAILQANKSSYKSRSTVGQIKILESRKYKNTIDTLSKIQWYGGAYQYFTSENVKYRSKFLKPKFYSKYNYTYKGYIPYNKTEVYIIDFKSKKGSLKGTMYIDKNSYAYLSIDYSYTSNTNELHIKRLKSRKRFNYFLYQKKMHLKNCIIESYIFDKTSQKELKLESIFLTTEVKDSLSPIPFDEQLLSTDIFTIKTHKFDSSNTWTGYNVLKKDSVFIGQKDFLKRDYTPSDKKKFIDYLIKYMSKFSMNFSVGFIPMQNQVGNYNLIFQNNNKTYTTSSSITNKQVYFYTFSYYYQLTRKHQIFYTESENLSNQNFLNNFDLGYAYKLRVKNTGIPIYSNLSIAYSNQKIGTFTGNLNDEKTIEINGRELNSDIIASYVGNKSQGLRFSIDFSIPISETLQFFVEGSYYYSLINTESLFLKEKSGCIFTRKQENMPMNEGQKLTYNGSESINSRIPVNNFQFSIGIKWGINLN